MRRRLEVMFGSLMNGIMRIGQTHCIYVIEPEDYDAFTPRKATAERSPHHSGPIETRPVAR